MKTTPYSIHVDEDVAQFLDRHKKRAGASGSRGAYVSRAIRVYENLLDEKAALREQMDELDRSVMMMRKIAREAYMARNRFRTMFTQVLNGGVPDLTGTNENKEWIVADTQMQHDIDEEVALDKYGQPMYKGDAKDE